MDDVFSSPDVDAISERNAPALTERSLPFKKRARSPTDDADGEPPRQHSRINYPKKRVSVACELCRARKTRCDAKRPSCSFCSQIGVECNYRKTIIPQRYVPELESCHPSEFTAYSDGSQVPHFTMTPLPSEVSRKNIRLISGLSYGCFADSAVPTVPLPLKKRTTPIKM